MKKLPAVNISFKKSKLIDVLGGLPDEIEEYKLLPLLEAQGEPLVWDKAIYVYGVNDQKIKRSMQSFFLSWALLR